LRDLSRGWTTRRQPNGESASFPRSAPRYPVENLQEALGEGIATGHAAMPEFKFEPKQVDEIIDYLKTLERQ
jgi:cytochrome c